MKRRFVGAQRNPLAHEVDPLIVPTALETDHAQEMRARRVVWLGCENLLEDRFGVVVVAPAQSRQAGIEGLRQRHSLFSHEDPVTADYALRALTTTLLFRSKARLFHRGDRCG